MQEHNSNYKTLRLRVEDVERLKSYAGKKHNGVMTKALNQLLTQDAIDDYNRKKEQTARKAKLLQVVLALEENQMNTKVLLEALKKEITCDNE